MASRVARGRPTVVLDSDGLSKIARGDVRAEAQLTAALQRQASVLVPAATLTEVLRGGARDAAVHRVLKGMDVVDITASLGRAAGELIGRTEGATALDAIVATVARSQPGPVVLLTSDVADLRALTEGADVTVLDV